MEVMVSLIIGMGMVGGIVYAYSYGVQRFDEVTLKYMMLNEGTTFLRKIEPYIRVATSIEIENNDSDSNNDRLIIHHPDIEETNGVRDGIDDGNLEFYMNSHDLSIRLDDERIGHGEFNELCLPTTVYYEGPHDNTGEYPYKVTHIDFEFYDEVIEDQTSYRITAGEEYAVKIDITLEYDDTRDDEDETDNIIKLSTVIVRNN